MFKLLRTGGLRLCGLLLCLCVAVVLSGCGATQPGSSSTSSTTPPAATPQVSSITPTSVPAGAASFPLTVNGTGFTASSVVRVNAVAETTTYVSSTQLQAVVSAAQVAGAGSLPVVVSNGSASSSPSQAATLQVIAPSAAAPVITSLAPASVPAGSAAFALTVSGSGFTSESSVEVAGSADTTTYVSASVLQVAVPAAQVASAGSLAVVVQNGSGPASQPAPLTVSVPAPPVAPAPPAAPSITTLAPGSVPAGVAAQVTLTGSGFVQGSVVQWNGSARPTAYGSATQLTVSLTAADLGQPGTGSLTVSNPDGTTSAPALLTVTAAIAGQIQNVTLQLFHNPGQCDGVQATITSNDLPQSPQVSVNGVTLQGEPAGAPNTQITVVLPFLSGQHTLTFTITDRYNPTAPPLTYTYPATAPAVLAVCTVPTQPIVYAGTGFQLTLQDFPINIQGSPTASIGTLPVGVSLVSPATLTIPDAGAIVQLKAAATAAAGSVTLPITASGSGTADADTVPITLQQGAPPAFSWQQASGSNEQEVVIGASTTRQFTLMADNGGYVAGVEGSVDYTVTPTVSGLPAGVTGAFSPATVAPGETTTLTLTAAASAPVSMNTTVTVSGTAEAPVTPGATTFLLDVARPPGTSPDNGADFTPTGGFVASAVFDAVHQHIFVSDPNWNRVDVLDAGTHKVIHEIDVRSPSAVDLAPDGSRLWVGAGAGFVYSVDLVTFAVTSYPLPVQTIDVLPAGGSGVSTLYALANGQLLLGLNIGQDGQVTYAVWTPGAASYTPLQVQLNYLPAGRSGDGSLVYFLMQNSQACYYAVYTTASGSLGSPFGTGAGCTLYAVNHDGSRLVLSLGQGAGVFDGSFTLLGTLPSIPVAGSEAVYLAPSGSTLYQLINTGYQSVINTIALPGLQVLGTAPAIGIADNLYGFAVAGPILGQNSGGLLLSAAIYGISFDDPTFYQHYAASQNALGELSSIYGWAGPLAGGTTETTSSLYSLTPDAWYGALRGSATLGASDFGFANTGELTLTSPPSPVAGPVNLKLLFPDGEQQFAPWAFTYGVYPQYSILSGSAPSGGAPGEISGYGLPSTADGSTVTVGNADAAITTQKASPTGEPLPSTFLGYTMPAGSPGWTNLTVTTPNGSATLPRAVFYARSVNDYSSPDTFTAVLYDARRNQLYLSAGDHIDVFSLASNSFTTPLTPAALGPAREFAGLALTPDGSELLAADLTDGSLAIVNPDAPAETSAIAIVPPATVAGDSSCSTGPLYVAATADGNAFVTTGSLPALSCGAEGILYQAHLQARTAAAVSAHACKYTVQPPGFATFPNAHGVQATSDGGTAVIGSSTYDGSCLYSAASGAYTSMPGPLAAGWGAAISGDGNVTAGGPSFDNGAGFAMGSVSLSIPYAPSVVAGQVSVDTGALLNPQLDASGSLYYWPFPSYVDIDDVAQGTLRLRFSLQETITNTAAPLAITPAGDQMFLLTNKGLTVVDLGTAPLSIGSLSPASASPGSQVTVRGSGFASGLTATVGGDAAAVSVIDANTLTLTVPQLGSGPQDIVLTSPDGETYTLQSQLVVQ